MKNRRLRFIIILALIIVAMPLIWNIYLMEILRRIWVQQFYWTDGKIYWCTKDKWGQPPAGKMIGSPDDLEARYCVKRSAEWHGYNPISLPRPWEAAIDPSPEILTRSIPFTPFGNLPKGVECGE